MSGLFVRVLVLVPALSVSNLLVSFPLYESVFIAVLFVIMYLGYRFERLMASYIIILHPFLFSSPAPLMTIVLDKLSASEE